MEPGRHVFAYWHGCPSLTYCEKIQMVVMPPSSITGKQPSSQSCMSGSQPIEFGANRHCEIPWRLMHLCEGPQPEVL